MMFNGMRVVRDNMGLCHKPRLQVSPAFQWITPEARKDMDDYLLRLFGSDCLAIQMGGMLMLCDHAIAKLQQGVAHGS